MNDLKKRGQVAIFVIIALVIVGSIITYFVLKQGQESGKDSAEELNKVFDYYDSCIKAEATGAIQLAGQQGGRVDTGVYVPGSDFAPFSSQLNFLGTPVPYWYYISANGVIKENVPSKAEIEREIAEYVKEGLKECDFEIFAREGFSVYAGEPEVNVKISEREVEVNVDGDLRVSKGETSALRETSRVIIDSKLGKFYDLAREIYSKEKSEGFLERYAADVLYLYAPVDGVELQCAPKVWSSQNVMNELREGIEQNFATLRLNGNYYELKRNDSKYFVVDIDVDESINVMYSRNWPTKIEIAGEGVDNEVMLAEPVGIQEGLGIMGFCYVPYHFVYDLSFPTLIQIYNEEELFQFPVVVVIDKNVPRNALAGENPLIEQEDYDLCEYKTQNVEINLYDLNLNSVDANISYECFKQRCRLGESRNGRLVASAPACINGYLHVRAEGFAEKKQLFSTNNERVADVIMEKEYNERINLNIGGRAFEEGTMAIVSFVRDDGKSTSASLPAFNEVKLSEGNYKIKVYVYDNSSITIPGSTKTQCVNVPRSGLLGLFGGTKEKCFDINIPETRMNYALIGGGTLEAYLLDSELQKGQINIRTGGFKKPSSLEELQKNFESLEANKLNIDFGNEK